ncbi:uncharacterized protein LOC124860391 isoform X1 [Girardinichthys multiradiatus]|uniref:uncharacterized protein LOC124860391 isoform X1 n=1 Tax=Girardinichthys multiradiatus TaxID=208333 RepID=UPI001FAE175F|nr:uncharacterized protein LOC124860391 isoform X1 [Girardinichthys multiradiatus]
MPGSQQKVKRNWKRCSEHMHLVSSQREEGLSCNDPSGRMVTGMPAGWNIVASIFLTVAFHYINGQLVLTEAISQTERTPIRSASGSIRLRLCKIHNRCNDGRTEEWKNPRRGWSKGTRNKGKREDMRDERRKCKKEGGKNNRKENKVGKNKSGTGQRTRSSRSALMVSDMALWLGLAQASELLKYLHSLQNERLIHFKSVGAERQRARTLFHLFTY